jgi:hypothetical protein
MKLKTLLKFLAVLVVLALISVGVLIQLGKNASSVFDPISSQLQVADTAQLAYVNSQAYKDQHAKAEESERGSDPSKKAW